MLSQNVPGRECVILLTECVLDVLLVTSYFNVSWANNILMQSAFFCCDSDAMIALHYQEKTCNICCSICLICLINVHDFRITISDTYDISVISVISDTYDIL